LGVLKMSDTLHTSSNYISLNRQEVMLEFEYNSFTYSSASLYFMRILNKYNNSVNYLNFHSNFLNRPRDITGNTFERTVQQLDEVKWVKFDFEKPIGHFEKYNPGLDLTSTGDIDLLEVNVTYHTIKIHILQGYNFEDIEGLVLRLSYKDTKGNTIYVGNIAYNKEYSLEYNATPFKMGDRIFDKYIKVSIPDIEDLYALDTQLPDSVKKNDRYYGMANFPDRTNSKINLEYLEIGKSQLDSMGQTILSSVTLIGDNQGTFRTEIETEDLFAGVAAVVRESGNGDFFEMFPTYNGQFLEDYFAERSRQFNNQFVVFHDIQLYEHLFDFSAEQSYNQQVTHRLTHMQESNFNDVLRYRPIIVHPDTQAFSIDYTVRILDKTDNFYVIRKATYTYPDASKYGRYLSKININEQSPVKIVNKILKSDNSFENNLSDNPYLLSNSSDFYAGTNNNSNIIVPIQYNKIFINGETYLTKEYVDTTNIIESEIIENSISDFTLYTNNVTYGQGDLVIYLNEFDNFIKFTLYRLADKTILPYNDIIETATTKFYLIFKDVNGAEIRIEQYKDDVNIGSDAKLTNNNLFFKITATESTKILKSNNNTYNITMARFTDDTKDFETTIYHGTVDSISNFSLKSDYNVQNILNQI